jgi:hypothetical protein
MQLNVRELGIILPRWQFYTNHIICLHSPLPLTITFYRQAFEYTLQILCYQETFECPVQIHPRVYLLLFFLCVHKGDGFVRIPYERGRSGRLNCVYLTLVSHLEHGKHVNLSENTSSRHHSPVWNA